MVVKGPPQRKRGAAVAVGGGSRVGCAEYELACVPLRVEQVRRRCRTRSFSSNGYRRREPRASRLGLAFWPSPQSCPRTQYTNAHRADTVQS